MKTSDSVIEISKALCNAQKEMKPAIKDSKNPHFKSTFANLTSVWESIRIPITSNGLSIWQDISTTEKTVSVITRIAHISGEWIEFGPFTITLFKTDPQAIGSATSYAKRYAICAAVGVVSDDEDDDAEKAMSRENDKKTYSKYEPKPPIPQQEKKFIPITSKEWSTFKSDLEVCTPDYQSQVWSYLDSQSITSEDKVDKDLLDKLNRGIKKHFSQAKADV